MKYTKWKKLVSLFYASNDSNLDSFINFLLTFMYLKCKVYFTCVVQAPWVSHTMSSQTFTWELLLLLFWTRKFSLFLYPFKALNGPLIKPGIHYNLVNLLYSSFFALISLLTHLYYPTKNKSSEPFFVGFLSTFEDEKL